MVINYSVSSFSSIENSERKKKHTHKSLEPKSIRKGLIESQANRI